MAICLRSSFWGSIYYKILEHRLLPVIAKTGLTPNQMTLLGLCIAALTPLGFLMHPAAGLTIILMSGIADSMDGLMARISNQSSLFGAFLDSTLDRLSDFFYLAGFWVLFWRQGFYLTASIAIFIALATTLLISYVKARAQALGVSCNVGLFERGLRVSYLIIWALLITLFPAYLSIILWIGLLLYCGLALFTVLQRIQHVFTGVKKGGDTSPTD